MNAEQIIAAARACLGTPFVHQGRIPGQALDCAGLVMAVAQSIGADYQDQPGYGRTPANGLLQQALNIQPCLERVKIAERQPGDVLLMRFATEPQHLAIDAGDTLIHSYQQVGKVCEHGLTDVWLKRIVAVYRFRGLS